MNAEKQIHYAHEIKSTNVQTNDDSSYGYIGCLGYFSCGNVDYLYNANGHVYCEGELSCVESNIYIDNGNVWCHGYRACANSNIYFSNEAYFTAYLSGMNTTIIPTSTNSLIVFAGYLSGYGAKIMCPTGYVCGVSCFGNGCFNLDLTCRNGMDTSCTFEVNCTNAFRNNICDDDDEDLILEWPAEYASDIGDISNVISISNSAMNSGVYVCDITLANPVNCGDYGECQSTFDLNDETTPVCCTADLGCIDNNNITTLVTREDRNEFNYNTVIRCDGLGSCHRTTTYIYAKTGGHIQFGGSYATGLQEGVLQTTNDYDIVCQGVYSCISKTIRNANNLFCSCYGSCNNSTLIENINNIWVLGFRGNHRSVMNNVGNIFCVVNEACLSSTVKHVVGKALAIGYAALAESNIETVNGSIVAVGKRCLYNTKIANVSNVCFSTS